jgi:Arc/MetJ family transcription regulator
MDRRLTMALTLPQIASRLDAALRAANLRIAGVSIPTATVSDRSTWRIDWRGDPSAEDRLAASIIVATLDVTSEDPPVIAPPPTPTRPAPVRKIDFLRLLLPGEYAAFVRLGQTDETMAFAQALFAAAPELRLDDALFVSLMQAVVFGGVLTPERAAAVLAQLTAPTVP